MVRLEHIILGYQARKENIHQSRDDDKVNNPITVNHGARSF